VPRTIDLQLLALAVAAGGTTASVALVRSLPRRVGAVSVAGALLLAGLADRWFLHAVPRDLVEGTAPWVVGGAVALAAAWGASRLPSTPTARLPPILPIALGSLFGVWAGVPETSTAILGAGVLVGVGAVLVLGRALISPRAALLVAVVPVGAATSGAVGGAHALVGGLLCSAAVIVVGVGPAVPSVSAGALAAATALNGAAALVAARQVGVARDWGGTLLAGILVLGLSLATAAVLRRDQGGVGP
jgi:hypothetical protein